VSRAERLFALAQYLQSKTGRTLDELAHRFEVSERTVFRDLAALQEAGVPIVFAEGRYRIHDAQPPPLSLDSGELALVRLALSSPELSGRRGALARAVERLRAKLEEALRARRSPR